MVKPCEDQSPHGWTLDTLEEYLTSKVNGLDKFFTAESKASKEAVSAALAAVKEQSGAAMLAAEKAILKAESATEKRFEAVNEFRETLSDQASHFMSRNEYSANYDAILDKYEVLSKRIGSMEGRDIGKTENVNRTTMIIMGFFTFASTAAAVLTVLITLMLKP